MKKSFICLGLILLCLFSSCAVRQIGKVNMISNRNIDSGESYKMLSKNTIGGNKRQLKKIKCKTIDTAIDKTVLKVEGGEYLMNARIYLVEGFFRDFYAVEGDVWGVDSACGFAGFKIGDVILYKYHGNFEKGVIISFVDNEECIIKTQNGKTKKVKIENLFHNDSE